MEFRINRSIVRRFKGFPPEDENEGDAEHLAMLPEERLATAAFILSNYVAAALHLPEVPRMDRTNVRIVRRGESD